jgi:hypothetical protein
MENKIPLWPGTTRGSPGGWITIPGMWHHVALGKHGEQNKQGLRHQFRGNEKTYTGQIHELR